MLSTVDVDNLLTSFASKHRLSASFQAFKEQWRVTSTHGAWLRADPLLAG